jgi:ribonuclease III
MNVDDRQSLFAELQTLVGHVFANPEILNRALTHRSYAHEHVGCRHNEAYELLGDAVLGFLVCEWLLERFPEEGEGRLAKMKAYLVSENSLDEIAREVELGKYLLLNRGEEKTGGRHKRAILVDAFEALVAAIYLDGGVGPARAFVRDCLKGHFSAIDPTDLTATDYKSALQEALQASGLRVPIYRVSDITGPDHRRTFHVDVVVQEDVYAQGQGQSIKRAEQAAARHALDRLIAETIPIGPESEDETEKASEPDQVLERQDRTTTAT